MNYVLYIFGVDFHTSGKRKRNWDKHNVHFTKMFLTVYPLM